MINRPLLILRLSVQHRLLQSSSRLAHVHGALSFVSAPVILIFITRRWANFVTLSTRSPTRQIVSERKSRRYSNVLLFFLSFIASSFFFPVALKLLQFPSLFLSFLALTLRHFCSDLMGKTHAIVTNTGATFKEPSNVYVQVVKKMT